MKQNYTTPFTSLPHNQPAFPGYFALISLVLLTLIGSIVAVVSMVSLILCNITHVKYLRLCVPPQVCYFRRRSRIDELRHRLIPLYSYDPAEDEEEVWRSADGGDEDKELVEPLYKEAQLSFSSDYGT